MKKLRFLFCILFCFSECSEKTSTGDYPVIDVANSVGKYKRVYCSDYFSSIELIPLETKDNCLIGTKRLENIVLMNDSLIFVISEHFTGNVMYSWKPRDLLVFD